MLRQTILLILVSLAWLQGKCRTLYLYCPICIVYAKLSHFVVGAIGGRFCPAGKKICSNEIFTVCYDPKTEDCWGGVVCKLGERACGSTCYNPNEKVCHSGGALCKIGEKGCGRECYDPNDTTKNCIDYGWGDILCGVNQTNCQHGFGEMYCCDKKD